jgi:ParB-like chromosome segregation protein Spo0J
MEIRVENEVVMRPINTIKPYVRNPRKNDKTVELLCKVIPKVGFNVPLVIDKDGIIVKGHARFTAAIRLGMKELPCIITHADEEAIKADRIADNKISEFSEWVNEELMHELDMIDIDLDMSELGFPSISFDDIPDVEGFSQELEKEQGHEISEEERQRLYQEFLEQQAQEQAVEVQMTSEKELAKAKVAQKQTAGAPPQILQMRMREVWTYHVRSGR